MNKKDFEHELALLINKTSAIIAPEERKALVMTMSEVMYADPFIRRQFYSIMQKFATDRVKENHNEIEKILESSKMSEREKKLIRDKMEKLNKSKPVKKIEN